MNLPHFILLLLSIAALILLNGCAAMPRIEIGVAAFGISGNVAIAGMAAVVWWMIR